MIMSPKLVARTRELKAEAPDCLLLMEAGTFTDVLDQGVRVVVQVTALKPKRSDSMLPTLRGGSRCGARP
jgi:hypothetical protein